jgi:hypothetical protein
VYPNTKSYHPDNRKANQKTLSVNMTFFYNFIL